MQINDFPSSIRSIYNEGYATLASRPLEVLEINPG